MLFLVRRPRWLSLGRSPDKSVSTLPCMLLIKFDDGSFYLKIGKALLPLKSVPMKRKIFLQCIGEVDSVGSKHFISRFLCL